ncbi:MAG TPA: GNAT family N-acetyltransferase [Candidatus Limnocylindrales bacterium]|nr:GNAT family N-acetyltransferase [Candidatus Limnocylindrales bacterium]
MTMTTTTHATPRAADDSRVTYRRYRGPEDLPGMAEANQRLRSRCGQLEPTDLTAMQHRYAHLVNSDPLVDCLIAVLDDRTVGYARVEWHDLTDGDRRYDETVVVEPAAWGHGVGEALIRWSEARNREVASTVPTDRRAWFMTYVFDGDEELDSAVRALGYEAVRWDAEMLRPTMDNLPTVPALPTGYEIRPVRPEDMPAVVAMTVEAFREHWGETEETEDELADWIENPRFDIDLLSVVWHGDEPASVVSVEVQDYHDGAPIACVDGVATHPGHRRLGLARAALADALHRIDARGLPRAYLGVDTDNHNRAFALYEDAGFRKVSGTTAWRKAFDDEELLP